jgi:hypothetical protein
VRAGLAAIGALLAFGVGATAEDQPLASDRGQSLPTDAPLAIRGGPATRSVTRVDPITLAPKGPNARLGEYHHTHSFSPNGSTIAFGISAPNDAGGGRIGIRLVDARDLTIAGNITTGVFAAALAWLEPRRIVGLLGDQSTVVIVDPATGAILERVGVPRSCEGEASEVRGQALISLAGSSLSVVRSDATVETVPLPRAFEECGQIVTGSSNKQVLVVAAGGAVVAEVALASSRLTVHRVGRKHVGDVEAVGLGRRRLLLALRGRSGRFSDGRPRGVELLDTEARSRETIDGSAGEVRVSGGTLLAFEGVPFARGQGLGLRGYGLDGRRRFRLLKGEHIGDVEIAGRFAYALVRGGGVAVIDTRSRTVVHRSKTRFHGDLLTEIKVGDEGLDGEARDVLAGRSTVLPDVSE